MAILIKIIEENKKWGWVAKTLCSTAEVKPKKLDKENIYSKEIDDAMKCSPTFDSKLEAIKDAKEKMEFEGIRPNEITILPY